MLKNLFKTTVRAYLRNSTFTLLNLTSIVVGLFVAYIGISYISFELSYDKFHSKADQIYRLARTYRSQDYSVIGFPNWSDSSPEVQQSQIENLKTVPGVKNAVQFITSPYNEFIEYQGKRIENKGILTTNSAEAFTTIFTWNLISGSLQNFSQGVNKVMITSSLAEKLMQNGNKAAIDQAIRIGDETFILAAIIEDVPVSSHFDFDVAISKPSIDYWGSRTYLELLPNSSLSDIEKRLNSTIAAFDPRLASDELYKGHYLQPISSVHLESDILYESKTPGNKKYIFLIGFVSLLILTITVFNYSNLTLAIKTKQSKSIGVNKVLGANNWLITIQLAFEGIFLALLAVPIVSLLIYLLIPKFNQLMSVDLITCVFSGFGPLALLISISIMIGIIASIGPANFYLGKKAIGLFKGQMTRGSFKDFNIRKYLIVSQLAILICISSISYFIYAQLSFIEQKEVGFRKNGVLFTYCSPANLKVFQEKLRQIPNIEKVGIGTSFGIRPVNQLTYKLDGDASVFDDANQIYLNYEGVEAYDLQTTIDLTSNEPLTIISKTAAKRLAKIKGVGINELIGQQIITEPEYVDENTGQIGFPFTIAGFFEDINLFSLHEQVRPYFLNISNNLDYTGTSIIAYERKEEKAVLEQVQKTYNELNEPFPLEVEFLEQNLNNLYAEDIQIANLLFSLNAIAILLALLGIIGMTLFITLSRVKEIGIRKVLGATSLSIVKLATKEYVLWVAIAAIIAWPVAFYLASSWLDNFAYRVEIQQFMIAAVSLSTLLLTCFVVGIISYKASLMDPVESLKSE